MTTEEVLLKCGISYEDKGNRYMACCPYHSEKTPSFSIYKEGGNWVCFGCGKKGKLSKLLMDLTGERGDWKPEYKIAKESTTNARELRLNNYDIDGELFDVLDSKYISEFCWSIGFSNSFIEHFGIKYFKKASFNLEGRPSPYYYNRIMIPCYYNGEIYNYECRDFTRKSSVKVLYPKLAENDFLFNWDNLDKSETVYITEGIKGLSHIWDYYSHNVVSTFGRVLKENQKKLLSTLPKICDVPDNDLDKIDAKTGKPVDNVLRAIQEYDSFYPNEYMLAIIKQEGADPANLTRSQIVDLLSTTVKPSDWLFERFNLFPNSKTEFTICK